ncbi:MAG TPA: hypothetical protein VD788_04375 [Candidatus Polarisedimenticolaceae bacterium]|nr:hypothetical protein [Candidatus Polarisedimenticolaceae bacterium]
MVRFRSWIVLAVLIAAGGVVAAGDVSLTYRFTNQGLPLDDPSKARFYVYADDNDEVYLAWGSGERPTVTVPEGSYHIVVKYVDDLIEFERVFEEVELADDVEIDFDFDIPVAHLTMWITSGGFPIPRHAGRYSLYRRGEHDKPLVSRRPGESVTIAPGSYDVEIVYRGPDGLESQWLEDYALDGMRQETIDLGTSNVQLRMTLVDGGRALEPGEGEYRVYAAGSRDLPLAEAPSGEAVMLSPGTYDVGLFYTSGGKRAERWVVGVEATGHVDREVDVSTRSDRLTVDIRHGGRTLPDAWFTVYPAGDRTSKAYEGNSGQPLEIEPGTYDIGCFVRRGGLRASQWIENKQLEGPVELTVELDYREASLRVEPASRRPRETGAANLLIVVDSSASMMEPLDGSTKMEQLRANLPRGIDTLLGTDINVGLRVYGITPRARQNCTDSTLLIPVRGLDRRAIERAVDLLRPTGSAPIAHSLEQAASDLPQGGPQSMLLITGGGETCGGDACTAASSLLRDGGVSRIYVIALGADRETRRRLDCVGEVRTARSQLELQAAIREVLREVRRGDEDAVLVFDPSGDNLIASGGLRERIQLTAGTYDVVIRNGDKTYRWDGLDLHGDVEAKAGSRPPRGR